MQLLDTLGGGGVRVRVSCQGTIPRGSLTSLQVFEADALPALVPT